LKPKIENENLHEIINGNGVIIINFKSSKNLVVKGSFPHRRIYKNT